MEYDLYLKYEAEIDLNMRVPHLGTLCEPIRADIMYSDESMDKEAENDEDEEFVEARIGKISWLFYNQSLARLYGVNATRFPLLNFQQNRDALMELDYPNITQETIDAVGASTNANIIVLNTFGIVPAWRNKGLGQQVLQDLIRQMMGKCGYVVVLNAQPAQFGSRIDADNLYNKQGVELIGLETDREKAQFKLNAFLQRCGFRAFKNYENVFVCNVEQTVKELVKVDALADSIY